MPAFSSTFRGPHGGNNAIRIFSAFLLFSALLPLLLVHSRFLASSISKEPIVFSEWKEAFNISPADSVQRPANEPLLKDPKTIDWIDGCQVPSVLPKISSSAPPTGLVVTLALAPMHGAIRLDSQVRICQMVPTQLEYFLAPQKLDMLWVVQENSNDWTIEQFASCCNLQSTNKTRTWHNLDGTTIATTEYHYKNQLGHTAKVFFASTTLEYPQYIQRDPSILKEPIIPRMCEGPREYIQATRWYTEGMLNLGILEEYDYFLKVDIDILFVESIPFYLLQDMSQKNAIFGHTAEYHPKGSRTCAQGMSHAMTDFTKFEPAYGSSNSTRNAGALPPWRAHLCSNEPEVQRDTDQYYTNFIIGRVDFWQSPWVLEFSNFLNEYPEGFFLYRWTDQIFWHNAMGLFVRNYKDYVVDYTDLRCMPDPQCWLSSSNFKKYGEDAWHQCNNGGFFLHPKSYRMRNRNEKAPLSPVWNATQQLFKSTYDANCSKKFR